MSTLKIIDIDESIVHDMFSRELQRQRRCAASMFLIANEQTKLTANWFNTLATALVAAGTFAPLAALFYGFSNTNADHWSLVLSAAICLVGGLALHLGGRALLWRLRE